MGAGVERIREKISSFKKKYYLNVFVKGALLSLSILFSYFLIAALLEYNLWLGQWARLLIFLIFFVIVVICLYWYLKEPLQWWLARRGLTEEQSARIIGNCVPQVKDRLLNLIQLSSPGNSSPLAFASVEQKSKEFESISFDGFLNLNQNRKYLKYFFIPLIIIIAILIVNRGILTQSTTRLVHFNREYSPQAPFRFMVENESLDAFFNESYLLKIRLDGKVIPESAYIIIGNQRLKLEQQRDGVFTYLFDNVQEGFGFQVEAAGFFSDVYNVSLVNRPDLSRFNVELNFPPYLHRKSESLVNAGNLEVPEGTLVKWVLSTSNAQKAQILFGSGGGPVDLQSDDKQVFTFSKGFKSPDRYEILLQNNKSTNKEKIAYRVDVIKDEFPKIEVNQYKDSVLYKMVVLSGMISDDYGITRLSLHFTVSDDNHQELFSRTSVIPILKNESRQSFFHPWTLDSLKLNPGDQLAYYLEVWDNDGVNGSKSTKTSMYTFLVPTSDNLVAEIQNSQSKTREKIDQGVNKANKLQQQIDQASQKLKGKNTLDWQDKKMLEDIVEQKQGLDKLVDDLKDQNRLLEQKKDAFTEQDERIREKAEQIQKLMDELLDEETKKLFAELQKLLSEKSDVSQIQKILDKLNQNTNNLEKELERTLELFKQLQYEFKMDQATKDLQKQIDRQKELLEKTESLEKKEASDSKKDDSKSEKQNKADKNKQNADQQSKENGGEKGNEENNAESQELAKDQEELKQDFKKLSEEIQGLKDLGEELQKDDELPSEQETGDIQESQEESKESLEKNSPSQSKGAQQKAVQKMQSMKQQMESSESSMSMEIDMQNLETLRQIVHGLVKLSFDEENLMGRFDELSQNDPGFNAIAQQQLKLKDDAKVLEDSLLALGKRDPFMGSIVTREVGDLNEHMAKVIEANRDRRRPQAASEMQMTMTSINNLALMLDDHFDAMMQMMANAKPSSGKSKKKGQKPSLSQMQQQLNGKIQELKESGKSGRQLSEELAQMAAEQERIRKALEEMQDQMKDGKMPGGDISSKMEQSEMDLVNKELTEQLIRRQQEIVTRLLQAEKSAREQDMDDERKGETAKDYEKEIPKAFEDYLRLKEKEVELLKTVPPKLYPYYKKEVSDYFKRVEEK